MHHHIRDILRSVGGHVPDSLRRLAKRRRGRGFGHIIGAIMDEGGFDRDRFRTGRKLASDDLQLLLLALIAEKPNHGYDLIRILEERSDGYYVPSPGMVYPALIYLEEAGYATVEPEGTKKLYLITDHGRGYLDQNRAAVDALFSQLERIGHRMDEVRRAFAGRDAKDDGDEGDHNELRQARRDLRRALHDRKHASNEESRRIAEILRRATDDITGVQ